MPKSESQKLKLLYIADYLMRETDADDKGNMINGVLLWQIKDYLKDLDMTIERPLHIFCNTANYVGRGARGTWVEIVEVRASFASSLMGYLRLHVEKLFCRCRNNISYVY